MLRILRSRSVSFVLLAAFLVGQPTALCAALCAVEQHHAGMPGMAHGATASGAADCHAGVSSAGRRDQLQVVSPMAPAQAMVLAVTSDHRVEPHQARSVPPRTIFRAADPPPPRLA
ncbi:MAG: hypothetical protein ACTHM9_15095 [Gemmatimonadales bacterium]